MSSSPNSHGSNPQKDLNANLPVIEQERYEILEMLGVGGMGMVLKARHKQLNKLVAIKVLTTNLSLDDESLKRFDIEAKAGSQLTHPNLIAVFDYGFTNDNKPYMVMEYVEGQSLQEALTEEFQLPKEKFLIIFDQTIKALQYIHNKNIIHRDIKTSNIMLHEIQGEIYAKLLDFGIAKVLIDSGLTIQDLTATGSVFGSPLYMSPEQCKGKAVDAKSDIYSLGCVMHECFTGMPPVIGENALDTIYKHLNGPRIIIEGKEEMDSVSRRIAVMIESCLAKEPENRYDNCASLLQEIKSINQEALAVKFQTGELQPEINKIEAPPSPEQKENIENGLTGSAQLNKGQNASAKRWTKDIDAIATNDFLPTEADSSPPSDNASHELDLEAINVGKNNGDAPSPPSKNLRSQMAGESARKPNAIKIALIMSFSLIAIIGAGIFFGWPALNQHLANNEAEKVATLADSAYAAKHWQAAEKQYEKLLVLADEKGNKKTSTAIKLKLANINLKLGNVDLAESKFKEVEKLIKPEKDKSPGEYTKALIGMAMCKTEQKKFKRSTRILKRAKKFARSVDPNPEILGDISKALGDNAAKGEDDWKGAVSYFDDALTLYSKSQTISPEKVANLWLDSAELCVKLKWEKEMTRRVENALALKPDISTDSSKMEIERRAGPLKALIKRSPPPVTNAAVPAITSTPTPAKSTNQTSPQTSTINDTAQIDTSILERENRLKKQRLQQLKEAEILNKQIADIQNKNTRESQRILQQFSEPAKPVSQWSKERNRSR